MGYPLTAEFPLSLPEEEKSYLSLNLHSLYFPLTTVAPNLLEFPVDVCLPFFLYLSVCFLFFYQSIVICLYFLSFSSFLSLCLSISFSFFLFSVMSSLKKEMREIKEISLELPKRRIFSCNLLVNEIFKH